MRREGKESACDSSLRWREAIEVLKRRNEMCPAKEGMPPRTSEKEVVLDLMDTNVFRTLKSRVRQNYERLPVEYFDMIIRLIYRDHFCVLGNSF